MTSPAPSRPASSGSGSWSHGSGSRRDGFGGAAVGGPGSSSGFEVLDSGPVSPSAPASAAMTVRLQNFAVNEAGELMLAFIVEHFEMRFEISRLAKEIPAFQLQLSQQFPQLKFPPLPEVRGPVPDAVAAARLFAELQAYFTVLWETPYVLRSPHTAHFFLPEMMTAALQTVTHAPTVLLQALEPKTFTVSKGTAQVEKLPIQAGQTIVWSFQLLSHDVGFVVKLGDTAVTPYSVVHADQSAAFKQGYWTSPAKGDVSLVWDNSYSRLRSKTVSWTAFVVGSEQIAAALEAEKEELKSALKQQSLHLRAHEVQYMMTGNQTLDRNLNVELGSLYAKISELQDNLAAVNAKRDQAISECSMLEEQMSKLKLDLSSHRTEIDSLEARLQAAHQETATAQIEGNSAASVGWRFGAALMSVICYAEFRRVTRYWMSIKHQMERELAETNAALNKAKDELAAASMKVSSNSDHLQQSLSESEQLIAQLREQLAASQAESAELRQSNEKLQVEVATSKDALEKANATTETCLTAIKKLKAEKKILVNAVKRQRDRHDSAGNAEEAGEGGTKSDSPHEQSPFALHPFMCIRIGDEDHPVPHFVRAPINRGHGTISYVSTPVDNMPHGPIHQHSIAEDLSSFLHVGGKAPPHCDSCRKVCGPDFYWRCTVCNNLYLCNTCYADGRHGHEVPVVHE